MQASVWMNLVHTTTETFWINHSGEHGQDAPFLSRENAGLVWMEGKRCVFSLVWAWPDTTNRSDIGGGRFNPLAAGIIHALLCKGAWIIWVRKV